MGLKCRPVAQVPTAWAASQGRPVGESEHAPKSSNPVQQAGGWAEAGPRGSVGLDGPSSGEAEAGAREGPDEDASVSRSPPGLSRMSGRAGLQSRLRHLVSVLRPQIWSRNTTGMYSLVALEVRNPKGVSLG